MESSPFDLSDIHKEVRARYLDDWLNGFMKYSRNSEPPDIFRVWSGVFGIAAALRRKCWIQWGHHAFYPNMYISLVAPAGKCRKGTALGFVKPLVSYIGVPLAADATTKEALIVSLKKSLDTFIDPNTDTLTQHCSLSAISKELTVFLGYENLQFLDDLCDWFDCDDDWEYDTKTQGTDHIHGVFLNLIGATTPDTLRNALPAQAVGGGLSSRFIFVYADKKARLVATPWLKPADLALYERVQADLVTIKNLCGQFSLTQSCVDSYVEWYTNHDRQHHGSTDHMSAYYSRKQVHLLKLAMIMSASRSNKMIITTYDFDRALMILDKTEVEMHKVLIGAGKNVFAGVLSKIMTFIAYEKKTTISVILNKFINDVDRDELGRILNTLSAMKFCVSKENGRGDLVVEYIDKEKRK